MVDPSGGSCRCACADDFNQDRHQEDSQSSGCCSPHVFTSVLLGILSCVLMTGGVFLAFHRWDPMWLMVSGVGVVLILIGTVLHCCNNLSQGRSNKRRSSGGKGCCQRPIPPEHHHVMPGGSLTEQLLPLSNARSVSQLSLNMLPGYFPPVVTAYGIEQHSAVVQNINRLVQQQQSTTGSCSPGVVSNGNKSFIVLSLPADATAANIQNLVATVYQLDGSGAAEPSGNEASQNVAAPVTTAKQNAPVSLILKNAEVQTCSMWPATSPAAPSGGENPCTSQSPSVVGNPQQPASNSQSSAVTGSTQTDDLPPPALPETVNLMDCSSDITPICDNATCDNQPMDPTLVDIPSDVADASPTDAVECPNTAVLVDIPEPTVESISPPPTTTTLLFDVVVTTPPNVRCSEVLVDIVANSDDVSASCNSAVLVDAPPSVQEGASTSDILIDLPQSVPEIVDSNLQTLDPELLSSSGNLSVTDTEIDDGELMERSSPPPSYEDVTLEGESVGAFGLAYGTI